MDNKKTPLQIKGINDSLYGGFWLRLGALLLDGIFVMPVVFLVLYLNSFGKNIYFLTFIPNLLFGLWYGIYLPKKYGGTPGKLVVGLKIIRLDGETIGWKESIWRYSINLVITIFSVTMMTVCILKADNSVYTGLSWLKQSLYLTSLAPTFFTIHTWTNNIWVYGELVVLLTNKRKRAIHDFIARTVIVKSKYIDQIRQTMQEDEQIGSR